LKKTKVYIDVFYYIAALSGIKTYIEELVCGLKSHGHNDIEYVFSHDIEKLKNNQFYINSKYRFIRWIFQFRYLFWKEIILPIKLFSNNADFVICPDCVAPILSPCKKIVVIHDNLIWKYPKNYPSLWRRYFIKLIKLGLKNNSQIVTTSKYSKNGLKEIFNNIKINYVYQSSEALPFKNKSKKSDKYILHIGTFEKRKDLLTLIKGFKKLKEELKVNYKLVLAGSTYINGDKSIRLKIEKYLNEHDLISSVLIPGYIDKTEASYFFSNAVMYVFPSIDEGFGIPLIEALKLKVPVVCSNIPIFKEIAEDSVLYFEKQNEIDLFEKMKELILNKNLSNKLTLRGLEKVKKFNRFNFIKDFEKIF
tara:strand:+ start:13310 stop:14401 length:1092 start_codon:yes stop_codon:yes gene_type:complete